MFALLSSRRATVAVAIAALTGALLARWLRRHEAVRLRALNGAARGRHGRIQNRDFASSSAPDAFVASRQSDDAVDRADEDSFPASDAPATHVIT